MEIYDENMEPIDNPDMTLGYLVDSTRTLHHAARTGVKEIWHYETTARYENGGRDVKKVIDVAGVEPEDAWEETIGIQIYRRYTSEELEARRQEAARGTMEERMARVEERMNALGKRIETALERMMMNMKGGETDGENHADAQQL